MEPIMRQELKRWYHSRTAATSQGLEEEPVTHATLST